MGHPTISPDKLVQILTVIQAFHADAEVRFDHEYGIQIYSRQVPSLALTEWLQRHGVHHNAVLQLFFVDALKEKRR